MRDDGSFAFSVLLVAIAAVIYAVIKYAERRAEERQKKPVTLMVCGGAGVGKSTLINAITGRNGAVASIGRPVTMNTSLVEDVTAGFAIYDTRGLEVQKSTETYLILISDLFRLRFGTKPLRQIDSVLLCIAEPSARIDAAHLEIANFCEDLCIPFGIALTKAEGSEEFRSKVQAAFPTASFIVPVRAIDLKLGSIVVPAEGVPRLTALLAQHSGFRIDEARRRQRNALGAHRMAHAALACVGTPGDAAWIRLAGAAYTYLLVGRKKDWKKWLSAARSAVKSQLVPNLLKRFLNTKFDDAKIDSEVAKRVLPRILRSYGRGEAWLRDVDSQVVVKEVVVQLLDHKPYSSRIDLSAL